MMLAESPGLRQVPSPAGNFPWRSESCGHRGKGAEPCAGGKFKKKAAAQRQKGHPFGQKLAKALRCGLDSYVKFPRIIVAGKHNRVEN